MYRPWGSLDWATKLSTKRKWNFISCLGVEERSTATPQEVASTLDIGTSVALLVRDPVTPDQRRVDAILSQRQATLRTALPHIKIEEIELIGSIPAYDRAISPFLKGSLFVDITSLPKRIFFYIIQRALKAPEVTDLILSYAPPERYPEGPLSSDDEPWNALLPSFRCMDPSDEKKAHSLWVVSVGFMPDGLIAYLDEPAEKTDVHLLIPFPASVAAVQRSWKSAFAIHSTLKTVGKLQLHESRTPACDISEAFDRICQIAKDRKLISFAPIGPKPTAAAMCIYATLTGSPVYYSQPKRYSLEYSIGVQKNQGRPVIHTYWIKHDGQCLYQV